MENFRGAIAQYEVIPYALIPVIAVVLPWLELIFGVMMILGYAPKLSSVVLGSFCLIFTLILGSSDLFLSSGRHDCGCFGEGSPIHLSMHQVFLLDFINFSLCIGLYRLKSHPFSLDQLFKNNEK